MDFMDMENAVKAYLLGDSTPISDIEDFLGYPISADILEELETHISNVFEQMPDEIVAEYYQKFCK